MDQDRRLEVRQETLQELRQGFVNLLNEFHAELNFTPEEQLKQSIRIEVLVTIIDYITDELQVVANLIADRHEGGHA